MQLRQVIFWFMFVFALTWAGWAAFRFGAHPYLFGLVLVILAQGAISFLFSPPGQEALGLSRPVWSGLIGGFIVLTLIGFALARWQAEHYVPPPEQVASSEPARSGGDGMHAAPPVAAQGQPASQALPTAVRLTLADRPCGIGVLDPSAARAGSVGAWQYYVTLAMDSQAGYDSLWDRIYLCTRTGAGAPGPYLRLEFYDRDDKPMNVARENFEIPVTEPGHLPTTGSSVHALPSGLISLQFEASQWVASMSRSMSSDQFSCDTNWCHVAIYKDFMDADLIQGKSARMTISNATKSIGTVEIGTDGYRKAWETAEKVWRDLREAAGPRHVKVISAKEEEARDERLKQGLPAAPPPQASAPPAPAASTSAAPAASAPVPAAPPVNVKASFPCASASAPGRRLICSDAVLARQDVSVAAMYRRALNVAADPRAVQADQGVFVSKRDSCTTRACVSAALAERRGELADWQ